MRNREHRNRWSPCMFTLLYSETVPLSRAPWPHFSASLQPLAWSAPFNCLSFLNVLEGISCSWAGQGWFLFIPNREPNTACHSGLQVYLVGSSQSRWQTVRAGMQGTLGTVTLALKTTQGKVRRWLNWALSMAGAGTGGQVALRTLGDETTAGLPRLTDDFQACLRL